MYPSLKNNNNEHLPFDLVKCTWVNTTGFNGTMFCDEWALLLFHAWWMLKFQNQHLCSAWEWTSGSDVKATASKATVTSLCHNVTQVVTWPITSYGGAWGKSPPLHAPMNRLGKKNSIFWINVILSVWPNDENHYKFSISNYFSSESRRNCWYSRGSGYATKIHFFLSCYQPFVFCLFVCFVLFF